MWLGIECSHSMLLYYNVSCVLSDFRVINSSSYPSSLKKMGGPFNFWVTHSCCTDCPINRYPQVCLGLKGRL